jgi:hypothetical protein
MATLRRHVQMILERYTVRSFATLKIRAYILPHLFRNQLSQLHVGRGQRAKFLNDGMPGRGEAHHKT